MALHVKWSSGDQIWFDGTQEIFRIKDNTDGLVVGTTGAGVPFQFHGNVTYNEPTTTNSTSDVTLTTTSSRMQFVDSCGEDVTWTLPAIADCVGIEFKIVNGSTGAITVEDTGSACIAVVDDDETGYLLCDGATWGAMVANPST